MQRGRAGPYCAMLSEVGARYLPLCRESKIVFNPAAAVGTDDFFRGT